MLLLKKKIRDKIASQEATCEPLDVSGPIAVPIKIKKSSLEKVTFYLILVMTALTPLLFSTSTFLPYVSTKTTIVILPILIIFILWVVTCLKEGSVEYPKGWLYPVVGLILLTYLMASIFSYDVAWSLFGQGFEIATFGFIFVLFLLLLLLPYIFKERRKILYVYAVILVTAIIIGLYHFLRVVLVPFLGVGFLSAGFFTELTTNTIGKWNDLAVYFGAITLLSLITLENLNLKKPVLKYLLWGIFILSLLLLSVANFTTVWYFLGAFSIISLVYFMALGWSKPGNSGSLPQLKIPYASLLVLVLSLVFVLGGLFGQQSLGDALSGALGVSQIEARPTWSATWDLAKTTVKSDPFLGVGPNRFVNVWLAHKPLAVNNTVFWNTDFNYGIGFIPTLFITTGLLGALPWLIFLALFGLLGFQAIWIKIEDRLSKYLLLSSFSLSLYFWLLLIFYIPSTVTIFMTFLFSGLFLATIGGEGIIKTERFIFLNNPRRSFLAVLVLLLLLIAAVSLGYLYGQKFIIQSLLSRADTALRVKSDLGQAEALVTSAISLGAKAPGYRLLTDVYVANLNLLLNQVKASQTTAEAIKADFLKILGAAVSASNQAVTLEKTNYENYLKLGQVYETVIPVGLPGSYEGAIKAYEQARLLNPVSPYIYLVLARVEVAKNDLEKAESNAKKALELKTDYTDAAFLLSQIQISEGKNKEALNSLETASIYSPNQPVIFFQIGMLKYSQKDYEGAALAFEKAVGLNQNYSNALYFLGLSYEKLGKIDWALMVFNRVGLLNPDNQEVQLIIKNLQAGRDPFANAVSPIDSKPEKRTALPIREKTAKTTTQR